MPPKKASKKAEEKVKQKIIEDKTFGLKNKKKSKTVQKYIKSVQSQVRGADVAKAEKRKEEARKAKEEKKERDRELSLLFKAVMDDDERARAKKSSGSKKIDLYSDKRDEDNIEDWDQAKLEQVINSKHDNKSKQTAIVCRHFLDAIEKGLYGWFWECPSGGEKCKYRHALPPGFVFVPLSQRQDADEAENDQEKTFEELIEEQRAALPPGGEPVTLESLMAWKERKSKEKSEAIEAKRQEAEKKRGGRGLHVLSGRALFMYDPSLFIDDDAAFDAEEYDDEEEVDEEDENSESNSITEPNESEDQVARSENKASQSSGPQNKDSKEAKDIPVNESVFANEDDVDVEDLEDD